MESNRCEKPSWNMKDKLWCWLKCHLKIWMVSSGDIISHSDPLHKFTGHKWLNHGCSGTKYLGTYIHNKWSRKRRNSEIKRNILFIFFYVHLTGSRPISRQFYVQRELAENRQELGSNLREVDCHRKELSQVKTAKLYLSLLWSEQLQI